MTIKDVKEEYKNKYIELEVYEAVSMENIILVIFIRIIADH